MHYIMVAISNLVIIVQFCARVDSPVSEMKVDDAKSAKQVRETEQSLLPGQFRVNSVITFTSTYIQEYWCTFVHYMTVPLELRYRER